MLARLVGSYRVDDRCALRAGGQVMSGKQSTRFERRGSAGWIRLTSPETRNALSGALVKELMAHLRAAHDDDEIRVIVLTGEGPAFCAGADLKNRGDMGEGERPRGNPFVDLLGLMRDGPKPVICAVNGAAFGGGLGLVAAGDIAIAAEGAKMSFSEVRLGVIPAMISVVVLPKLGEHQAMRLFLTGERFTADRALEYGLVHAVVPADSLEDAVDAEVDLICRGGPIAIREAKQLVRAVARLPEAEAFQYAEDRIGKLFASEEAAEGMAAFAKKRPPRWAPDA
jgi:methylglutaconyl-CoA hydratase